MITHDQDLIRDFSYARRWSSTIKRYDFLSSETSSHSWCIYILPRRLTYSQSPLPKPLPPPLLLPSNLNHPSQSLNSRLHQPSLRNCHDRIFVLFLTDVWSVFVSAVMVGVVLICAHLAFRAPKDLFLDEEEQDLSFRLFLSLRFRKYHFC